ncbi:MAG: hydantoinase/oxoprolinase family protein [Archaeoglobaceae archaeon]|nr:hydantoinase/oxoprolinase family protein [Archaeoglobaceae archaeon]MCX8151581.1 hydantoinase/oxoprolinase family protein [Archaeoglobaceae archaeon]MDW8013141.1 hydantoinase/oxoprolinase family protein [Archaeoglobaceae archaeon]
MIGIDVGWTNTHVAVFKDDEIDTIELPNELGISNILSKIKSLAEKERAVISTSLLNQLIHRLDEFRTLTILIPGPGMNYSNYGEIVRGFVNHRGDVVENVDEKEIRELLKSKKYDNIAIAAKFSVRNSSIEEKVKNVAIEFVDESKIALSYHVGGFNYLARINTTVINAKVKSLIFDFTNKIKSVFDNFYYYKGDCGITPWQFVVENPSLLYNSSSASSAIGAIYLTKEKNAVVIDIGGSLTKIIVVENGMPKIVDGITIHGKKTLIRSINSIELPFGGDSIVAERLSQRCSKPIAFGGKDFTFIDALNCLGYEIGDYKASREEGKKFDCEKILQQYISLVCDVLKGLDVKKIVGVGNLSSILVPKIAESCKFDYVIPKYNQFSGAIGVAVSKLSLTLFARFDTEKGIATYNGVVEKCPFRTGSLPSEEEVVEVAVKKLYEIARNFAKESEFGKLKVLNIDSYTVVRGGIRRGAIYDLVVQLEPGIKWKNS